MSGPTESSSRSASGLREAFGGLFIAAATVATLVAAFVLAYGEAGQLGVAPTEIVLQATTAAPSASPTAPQPSASSTRAAATSEAPVNTPTHTATLMQPPVETATELPPPATATTGQASLNPPSACQIPIGWTAYTVQPGDSMFRLAQRTGTTVTAIQQGNCLPGTSLFSGQVVFVPVDVPTAELTCGPPPGWVHYTVQSGDTLFNLSQRFGTTVFALQRANCLGSSTRIQVGGRILAPPAGAATPLQAPSATPTATTVVAGAPAPAATPVPELAFSLPEMTVAENAGSAAATVTLTRASAAVVTVDLTVVGGSASAGVDYSLASSTLTFNAGETSRSVAISISNDGEVEADETILLALANPTNSALSGINRTAKVIILNDDPQVAFSAAFYGAVEANADIAITVTLSSSSPVEVRVDFSTGGGSATAGSDYNPTAGALVFRPGEVSKSFGVSILDDSDHEAEETLGLMLSNPANATLGSQSTATLTIQDNDSAPVVSHSAAGYSVTEGTPSIAITVVLSGASVNTVTVNYTTNSGVAVAGSDFEPTSGVLIFAPGETSKTFSITIHDDGDVEGPENFTTTLLAPTNATLSGAVNPAIVTINDNDS